MQSSNREPDDLDDPVDRAAAAADGWAGPRIVVIDDHETFSDALAIALRGRGIEARAVPVDRLREFASRPCPRPGVVVLDLYLGVSWNGRRIVGREWIGRLRGQGWTVLVVTGSEQVEDTAAAIAEGAVGVIPKSSPLDVLLDAVLAASGGESLISESERAEWTARHADGQRRQRRFHDLLASLTVREREVLELIAQGMRAAEIADRSAVSVTTVRAQIRSILTKFGVHSQIEAAAMLRSCPDAVLRSCPDVI